MNLYSDYNNHKTVIFHLIIGLVPTCKEYLLKHRIVYRNVWVKVEFLIEIYEDVSLKIRALLIFNKKIKNWLKNWTDNAMELENDINENCSLLMHMLSTTTTLPIITATL